MTPGLRVYAVGDIHGRVDLLEDLLSRIASDHAQRPPAVMMIIILGDVIDRGPGSAAVLERLIRLKKEQTSTRFLMGNHEEIFLGALAGKPQSVRAYCRVGGRETLLSYGLSQERYERMDYEEVASVLAALVPECHRQFVASFEDLVVMGDFVFVHAGIDPTVGLCDQKPQTLRWIRDPFLNHRGGLEKMVVHGHTIGHEVQWQDNRIGIDTGAYATGRLSALRLEGGERAILQTSAKGDSAL